jgi:hypothetical protein
MGHGSSQNISNRLDASVRMPGKARQIILGHIVPEIVQQQERIEVRGIAESKRSPKMHSRAFHRGLSLDKSFHWSY